MHIFCYRSGTVGPCAPCSDGWSSGRAPAPHLVIGMWLDTVACGLSLENRADGRPIRSRPRWKGCGPLVVVAGRFRRAQAQAQPPERRYAFPNYEPETFDPSILASWRAWGLDCCFPDNQFSRPSRLSEQAPP